MGWLKREFEAADRALKRLPKWQQKHLRYIMCGNECRHCDGFGRARLYEPSMVASNPWISVACSCGCHRRGVMCEEKG